MKKLLSLSLAALLCLALAGCVAGGSNVVKTGFVSTQTARAWEARFKSYNGYESKVVTIPKGAGTLLVIYSVAAETGTLCFTLEDAAGLVILSSEEAGMPEGTVTRLAQSGEKYILRITGDEAKNGSFSLEWEFLE